MTSLVKRTLVGLGLAVCIAALPTLASANVTWILKNVKMSDGGLLNGSFTLDVYGDLTKFNVTTTSLGGDIYTPALNAQLLNGDTEIVFGHLDPGYDGALNLVFSSSLASPGPNLLEGGDPGPSYQCGGYEQGDYSCVGNPISYVLAADTSVSGATPEPAAWIGLLLGVGLMGATLRLGRRSALAAH